MMSAIRLSLVCVFASTVVAFSGCAGDGGLKWFNFGDQDNVATARDQDAHQAVVQGRSLEQAGEWDKAVAVYQDALKNHPESWELHHRLGLSADRQKRYAAAQQHYSEAIRLNPSNPQLFNDIGYCFYLEGKLGKAESALRKAIQLGPDNSRFRNNLGMVLGQQGRIDEAYEQFAKVGSEADALYNVAFIYASNDNEQAAIDCFQRALDADPTHEQAQEALRSFQRAVVDDNIIPVGRNAVRYDESLDESLGGPESSDAVSNTLPDNRDAGEATRQLHTRARGMLDRHLASRRNAAESQQLEPNISTDPPALAE